MPAETPQFTALKVGRLLSLVESGRFAVPRLQRAFVWNGRKAASLVDSLLQGLPVGALTIWEAPKRNLGLLPNSHHILTEFNSAHPTVWYLLDGQQRLSVLHHVRKGEIRTNTKRQDVDFGRVCLRLRHPTAEENHVDYRKPVAREWYPISSVLSPQWHLLCRGLPKRYRARIASARQALLSAAIPLVTVATNELEDARLLFIRINSLGTPLAAADRAFARAAQLDLRGLANESWDQDLTDAFRKLNYETLLQALALVHDIADVGERALKSVVKKIEASAVDSEARSASAVTGSGSARHFGGRLSSSVRDTVYSPVRSCLQSTCSQL